MQWREKKEELFPENLNLNEIIPNRFFTHEICEMNDGLMR